MAAKRAALTAALLALAMTALTMTAQGASLRDLGEIAADGTPATDKVAVQGTFDSGSFQFTVGGTGQYKITAVDQNTGPGGFGDFTTDVITKFALDVFEGGFLTGTKIVEFGFNGSNMGMQTFNATLGTLYQGSFAALVANSADLGEFNLTIQAVPVPPSLVLLASALGLIVIRRRREAPRADT